VFANRERKPRIIGYRKNGAPIWLCQGGAPDPDDKKTTIPNTLDDLRGRTPEELQSMVEVLDAHLRSLHQTDEGELRSLDEDEDKAFKLGLEIREKAMSMLDEHRRVSEIFRRRPQAVQTAMSNVRHGLDDSAGDVRRLTVPEARDRALRALDNRSSTAHLTDDQKVHVERQVRKDTDIARRILVTETEDYREAWLKLVTRSHPILSDDERRAVLAWDEYRAMSEGVNNAGGFGIPVFIDPSIIMTAQGSGNPFLEIAAQKTITTNAWKGVSSAGVSWSFDGEASVVSDDSPVLAQPAVTAFMARGFIPFSIEVGQDYPAFADEMATLLAEGYDELLVDKFTRGSGTGEPQGILTALSANTNVRVRVTASGALGTPDPYKVWKALPQRFRRKASWLMSVDVNNGLRQLGTANVFHAYTENLPVEWADQFFGKQAYESPYMPDTTSSTTATDGLAVVGDFANYVVARRGGMSVEYIPHLFDLTNSNRPIGQRGWFAYARIGGGSVNDLGFRLLVNT
jgi:HK97 family phage major capsid protein